MAYKGVTKHEVHAKNPFIEKAMEEISVRQRKEMIRRTKEGEGLLIVSERSGEVEGHTAFMRYIEVDEAQFAKLYLSELSALFDLTKPAIRVLAYLLSALKPNKDTVLFIMDDCIEYTKYKGKKDVLSGLSCLIESKIIARSKQEFIYFINPLIFFNGNRVTFAKTYVKKRKYEFNPNQIELFEGSNNEKALPSNNESGE